MGKAVASAFAWHSYRSGLATALHAAGIDDARRQLICRWVFPASLHVHRRLGSEDYFNLTSAAMSSHAHTLQSQNIARLACAPEFAEVIDRPMDARDWQLASLNGQQVDKAQEYLVSTSHAARIPIISNDDALAQQFCQAVRALSPDPASPPAQSPMEQQPSSAKPPPLSAMPPQEGGGKRVASRTLLTAPKRASAKAA